MIIIVIALLIIALVAVFIALSKKKGIELTEVEQVTLQMVVEFFKKPEILPKVQSDENLLCVAVKENLKDGEIKLVLAIFDKEKNTVKDNLCGWKTKSLDENLENSFGDKPMIVLN